MLFFFQAEDGIRDRSPSRGLGDVYKRQATEALNLVANTLGQSYLQEGDEVLITELEHHSNYVPWHFLRKSKNIKINFAEINEEGEITLEEIEKKITPKTKLISITH